jgi:hypothetical protein
MEENCMTVLLYYALEDSQGCVWNSEHVIWSGCSDRPTDGDRREFLRKSSWLQERLAYPFTAIAIAGLY